MTAFFSVFVKSGSYLNVPLNDPGNSFCLKILTIKSKKLVKTKKMQK